MSKIETTTHSTIAAVVRSAAAGFELEQVKLHGPAPDEALVEIHACGVCHMDIEAKTTMQLPCVMGHEGAGTVISVGTGVKDIQPGDHVVLGYGFCGNCPPCAAHEPYNCDQGWRAAFGGRRLDGTVTITDAGEQPLGAAFFQQSSFARHALTPASALVKIAEDVPWHIAASLPCGFLTGAGAALNVLQLQPDSSFLVSGTGAVGLGAIVAAKILGCQTIIAVDIRENRLEIARDCGATHTVNAATTDLGNWIRTEMPRGCSHTLDTSGSAAAFLSTVNCLSTGGMMAYTALPAPMEEFSFKPFNLYALGASLHAVSFGRATPETLLPQMLEWWSRGDFPLESMIKTFSFENIQQAIDASQSGQVIKPVIIMK